MIERIRDELLPYAEDFQSAGREGFRRVVKLPYGGDQWKVKHLQRDAFLNGLISTLPDCLGSFQLDRPLYAQDRLVYRSEVLDAELIFRRQGSLGAFRKGREATTEPGLFAEPSRVHQNSDDNYRQIALVWDLPRYDADHEISGVIPFHVYLAKDGTALEDCDWEDDFSLSAEDQFLSTELGFDPEVDDWEVEDEESNG